MNRKKMNQFLESLAVPFRRHVQEQIRNEPSECVYYLAYGSNLDPEQMAVRCPGSRYLGVGELKDYHLVFRGSKSGYYLSVEPCPGNYVPVVIWEISHNNETSLDHYEGYPAFYQKDEMTVTVRNILNYEEICTIRGLIYILPESNPPGCPTARYLNTCMKGYQFFRFDQSKLEEAVFYSATRRKYFSLYCRI